MFELKNKLEDLKLSGQNDMVYLHWTPDEWLDAPFYELLELQTARKPEDREVDPEAMLKGLGLM